MSAPRFVVQCGQGPHDDALYLTVDGETTVDLDDALRFDTVQAARTVAKLVRTNRDRKWPYAFVVDTRDLAASEDGTK